ncbi:MAG TPA: arylamine N-acetyltransferase [Coriobacteriaceae bacterium]|nr:arylamine N-acetyltransferase [Coriobacteriaceae bacterium]
MDQQHLIAYFDRIGLDEEPTRDIAGIGMMQRAHLETVPFENLDILAGKVPLDLSEEGLFDKIVGRGRGGICYELNFLYAAALHALGFDLELRGGRIYDDGDEFDHVFLMVTDPDNPASDPWITDVGFAYNIAAPIRFTPGIVQDDGRCQYRIDEIDVDGESWYHVIRIVNGDESLMFAFRDVAREPTDFDPRRTFFETDPSSRFLKGPLVCIDGEEGRVTLSMRRIKETRDGVVTERDIDYPDEFDDLLASVFKMRVNDQAKPDVIA